MFLAICLSILNLFHAHDFHVSIVDMELKDSRIQISQKLFSDDFGKALMLRGRTISLGDDLMEESTSREMQTYINEHFSISAGGKKLELRYAGAEWLDYHALYMYWESELLPENAVEIELYNDVFVEVHQEQQNMHHFRSGGKEESLLLNAEKKAGQLKIHLH